MITISTTNARKNISKLINRVRETGEVFAIGRRSDIDALLIKFPHTYNKNLSEITNINAYSQSFSFLEDEPDIYTLDDIKEKYA